MELIFLNKPQLDEFASGQKYSQFLQSWDWGEFQKSLGHKVWRFGVTIDNQLIAVAQIVEHLLPLNKSYLYCPRGPVVEEALPQAQKPIALKLILSKVRDITIATSQTEEIFFRFEPTFEIRNSKFEIHQTKPIHPPDTLILNLTLPEDELLMNMHHKTRYNIRLAERSGVIVRKEDDWHKVWPLFQETAKRDKFSLHPKSYYEKMMASSDLIMFWAADYKGKIVAANIIAYFGDTVTYIHGASDYENRSVMAPFLLQWEVIKNAQEQGYKYYDFHGVAPTNNKNHPWSGLTRFKKGFGGQAIHYPGTFDFVYQPLSYNIYKTFRKFNLFFRKLF